MESSKIECLLKLNDGKVYLIYIASNLLEVTNSADLEQRHQARYLRSIFIVCLQNVQI